MSQAEDSNPSPYEIALGTGDKDVSERTVQYKSKRIMLQ